MTDQNQTPRVFISYRRGGVEVPAAFYRIIDPIV